MSHSAAGRMDTEAPASGMASAEQVPKSKRFGRAFGESVRGLVNAARRPDPQVNPDSNADAPVGKFGQKYEEYTGRSAKKDGRIACLAGLGVVGVIGAGMALSAATQIVVTGVVVGAGVAGVAACCKVTGHDREYETIVNTSTTVISKVVSTTRDFAGGLVEGVTGGESSVDASEMPGTSGGVVAGGVPVAGGVAAAQSGVQYQPSATVAGQPLYPTVHAPVRPHNGDMISLVDVPPKQPPTH